MSSLCQHLSENICFNISSISITIGVSITRDFDVIFLVNNTARLKSPNSVYKYNIPYT